ncbi:MAG: DUF1858 domain-containing protein [Clostridiales bacterium]|nr:DUF1858 domain-containing protein [Clostridiales bacterium]
MSKTIDLSKSISELCKTYPEIMDFMKEMGFESISPAMLNTVGRFMTIPKGAKMRGLDLETIKQELRNRGFEVIE